MENTADYGFAALSKMAECLTNSIYIYVIQNPKWAFSLKLYVFFRKYLLTWA